MPIFRATSKYFPRSRQLPHFWCFSPFVAASYEGGGVSGLWKWWLSISERIRRSWIKRFQDLLRVQDRGTLWPSYKDYLISSPVLLSLELVPVWCKLSAASWSGFYVRRPGEFFIAGRQMSNQDFLRHLWVFAMAPLESNLFLWCLV